MATTKTNEAIARLRAACLNESVPPGERLLVAKRLLKLGCSERSTATVRKLLSAFESSSDPKISGRVQRLRVQLERAVEEARKEVEAKRASGLPDPLAARVLNSELLPPNEEDPSFWDETIFGRSRREAFIMACGLPPDQYTRVRLVEAIVPAEFKPSLLANLYQTADQLDAKFAEASAELRALLMERGLDDSQAGLDQLTASLQPPFYAFMRTESDPLKRQPYDPKGTGIPKLGLSDSGRLRTLIEFVKTWQADRTKYQPL